MNRCRAPAGNGCCSTLIATIARSPITFSSSARHAAHTSTCARTARDSSSEAPCIAKRARSSCADMSAVRHASIAFRMLANAVLILVFTVPSGSPSSPQSQSGSALQNRPAPSTSVAPAADPAAPLGPSRSLIMLDLRRHVGLRSQHHVFYGIRWLSPPQCIDRTIPGHHRQPCAQRATTLPEMSAAPSTPCNSTSCITSSACPDPLALATPLSTPCARTDRRSRSSPPVRPSALDPIVPHPRPARTLQSPVPLELCREWDSHPLSDWGDFDSSKRRWHSAPSSVAVGECDCLRHSTAPFCPCRSALRLIALAVRSGELRWAGKSRRPIPVCSPT